LTVATSIRATVEEHAATALRSFPQKDHAMLPPISTPRTVTPAHSLHSVEFGVSCRLGSDDPRDKLAGMAILLAVAELADCEADFVELPSDVASEAEAIGVLCKYLPRGTCRCGVSCCAD